MKHSKPKVILIDIMETVVVEPYLRVMPHFFDMTPSAFVKEKHPTAWIDFERGKLTEEEYFQSFFSDGRAIDGEGLKGAMYTAYDWLPGMHDLLTRLVSAGYPLYALSNYAIWYQMIEQKLNLSRYLHWDFVSCHTGHRKPEAAAYRHAAATLHLKPEECLFIDDRQVNIDGAKQIGMPAILFTGSGELERILVDAGVID